VVQDQKGLEKKDTANMADTVDKVDPGVAADSGDAAGSQKPGWTQ
jgi:hypothetical protein